LVECEKPVIREPKDEVVGIHGRLDFFLSYDGMLDRSCFDYKIDEDNISWEEELLLRISTLSPVEPRSWITELKSVSSMIFPQREIDAADNHKLQAGFYSIEEGFPAFVEYISKDDGFMVSHQIDTDEVKDKIDDWVKEVSGYYLNNERPPLETLIINDVGRVTKNWRVEYSGYLSEYGFENPMHYRQVVDKWIGRWNRVLKRMQEEKSLTSDNEKALDEMRTYFETGKLPTE